MSPERLETILRRVRDMTVAERDSELGSIVIDLLNNAGCDRPKSAEWGINAYNRWRALEKREIAR